MAGRTHANAQSRDPKVETAGALARRRMPAGERREAILEAAAELFADQGFDASTRTLAGRLGITQAALYKHFDSKDAIVAALFERGSPPGDTIDWRGELSGEQPALEASLGALYARFVNGIRGTAMRLFVRAGLDGLGQPGRRGAALTGAILEPVVGALRCAAGLPSLADRPMQHEEREIAMGLHGAVVFLAVRKHVYRMPMPDDLSAHAHRLVRLWLPGALTEIQALHRRPREEAVPQLAPTGVRSRPGRADRRNR